jgi:hypothetical protein
MSNLEIANSSLSVFGLVVLFIRYSKFKDMSIGFVYVALISINCFVLANYFFVGSK